jgi:hypothetical protein
MLISDLETPFPMYTAELAGNLLWVGLDAPHLKSCFKMSQNSKKNISECTPRHSMFAHEV